jgi:hypothetical protein
VFHPFLFRKLDRQASQLWEFTSVFIYSLDYAHPYVFLVSDILFIIMNFVYQQTDFFVSHKRFCTTETKEFHYTYPLKIIITDLVNPS